VGSVPVVVAVVAGVEIEAGWCSAALPPMIMSWGLMSEGSIVVGVVVGWLGSWRDRIGGG
jgi:hypothetical protein